MRTALQNLLLSVISFFLLFAVIEGGSRFVLSRRPAPQQRADYIWDWEKQWEGDFYTLASDETGWPPGAEFNGDGLRDRLHAEERPEGVFRVAFLGDSVTFGHGLEPHEAFPQVVQARLSEEGHPVEVMNVALWGWSTRQERLAYERIVRRYKADRLVLAVCLNDIPEIKNNLERPPQWLASLHERLALVRLLVNAPGREIQNVEELFSKRESAKVREGFELFFEEVRAVRDDVARDGGALAVLVLPFRFQLAQDAPPPTAQQEIAAFCKAERLPLLDLLPAIRRAGAGAFLDYDHLSVEGAKLVADEILKSGLLPETRRAPEVLGDRLAGSALADPNPDVRAAACWRLGREREKAVGAVEPLAARLRSDPSERVRAAAARALGEIGAAARGGAAALFKALADPRQAVRWAAADSLYRVGLKAADGEGLVKALESSDAYVRAFATLSLGELGNAAGPEAAEALAAALRAGGGAGRAGAAAALAKMGGAAKAAVPMLIQELKSDRESRRWRAARTLGRIGPEAKPAVPGLLALLEDSSAMVRAQAARALGRIGSRDAIDGLVAVMKSDPAKEVREEASRALSRIPGP